MAETARHEIATLLAAAHPGSTESSLLGRLDGVIDEARAHGLHDDSIEAQLRSWAVQFPHRRYNWTGADAAIADIRTLLIGPQSPGARAWHRLRSVAGWVFEHYIAVASLVTVIAGAFYTLVYVRFYEAFDITPEQVGLTPTQIVAHSALGGIALTLYCSTLVFAAILPLVPARADSSARSERGSWKGLAGNVIVLGCSACVFAALALLTDASFRDAWVLTAIPALFLLGISFRIRRIEGKRSLHLRPLRFGTDRFLTVFVAFAVPVSLLLTGVLTLHEAGDIGKQASEGWAIRDTKVLGLPFLDVRAEPALISWKDGQPTNAGIPHCVFYLGNANGDDVFYDHRSHSTFHIPSGEVTVELRRGMSSCEAPVNLRAPWLTERRNHELVCHHGLWRSPAAPRFSYTWTIEGFSVPNRSRSDRVFRNGKRRRRYPLLHCRVTASTYFGSETAVSHVIR